MSALPTEAPTSMYPPFRPRPEGVSGDLQLPAQPNAVGAARAFVRDQLNRWRLNEPTGYDLPGTAELITSELVTNSLKATGVPHAPAIGSSTAKPDVIILRLRLIRRSLFVEVWDANPCPPVLANGGELEENGRGLVLVTALAKAWDYYHSDAAVGGKVVWAEIDIPAELSSSIPLTGVQQVPPHSEPAPGPHSGATARADRRRRDRGGRPDILNQPPSPSYAL